MRRRIQRWAAALAVLLSAACAQMEAPSGGPTDSIPPMMVAIRPDTNAVLERWTGPVIFGFDEELSEEGVDEAVTLSPRLGPVAVDKENDEIRVQPRRGWQPGIIYQVEVAPGVRDRFNNPIRTPIRLVFSTGPAIPDTRAGGSVTERVTGSPATEARVDAMRISDSLVYSTQTDSAGRFRFSQVPEGEYRLLGYRDTNKNKRVDGYELRDTAFVTIAVGQAPTAELSLLPNDTTAPAVGSARITQGWVEIRFDDNLDPEQPLSPEQVVLVGPDSARIAIAEVRVGPPVQADTSGAEADSADAADAERPPAVQAAVDSAEAAQTQAPLPSQALFARPATELIADTTYVVRVQGVRNINGLVGGGEARLRTPRPPPPPRPNAQPAPDSAAVRPPAPDSAAVPADSAAAPAPTPPPPTPPGRGTRDDEGADARAVVVPRGRE